MPLNNDIQEDPGSNDNYNTHFLNALQAIDAHTEAFAKLIPDQTAALTKVLVDVYAKAGQPSRGTPGRRVSSRSPISSLGINEADARAALSGGDLSEEEAEGLARRTSGGPTGRKQTWRDRATDPGGLGSTLTIPRFPGSTPNPNDYLKYMTSMTANAAVKRQNTLNYNADMNQAYTIQGMATEGTIKIQPDGSVTSPDGSPLDADTQRDIDKSGVAATTKMGKVSDTFAGVENAYAQGKYIKGIIKGVTQPLSKMSGYGYETGYQGGSSGFMGFRSPFGGAAAGMGQKMSQLGFAMHNNVSSAQAGTIYNSLFSRGWYGGQSTNDMRTAGARIMQTNPMVGSSPETYDMMDKATREGAASLNSFVSVMKTIPDTAKAAHTSIADTMASMDAMGKYNSTIGGTYFQGMQAAQAFQSITGQPAAIEQSLLQNPFVQGQIFSHTGLMPQLQGLATPLQRTQGIMSSLNLLNKAIIGPHAKTTIDPLTGLSQTTSQQSQKIGLIANQLGLPPDVVSSMLKNQSGILHGSEMWNSSQAYNSSVSNAASNGSKKQTLAYLTGKPWQGLQAGMKDAVDSQGHHMFEDWSDFNALKKGGMSDKKAHAAAQLQARRNVGNAGDSQIIHGASASQLNQAMAATAKHGGVWGGPAQQNAAAAQYLLKHGEVTKSTMSKVGAARSAKIQSYIKQNTQKFGPGSSGNNGPSLTINLSAQARKMFNMSNPNGQDKANKNAGSATINLNPYVGGATADPMASMDTAASNMGDSDTFNSDYGGGTTP